MSTYLRRRFAAIGMVGVFAALLISSSARAARVEGPESSTLQETLREADGKISRGKLFADRSTGARFDKAGGASTPFAPGMIVEFPRDYTRGSRATPPFRVFLGGPDRLSGRLRAINANEILLEDTSNSKVLTIPRAGIVRIAQTPGETIAFSEGFETLDPMRWTTRGSVELVNRSKVEGAKSVRISGRDSSLTRKMAEPIASGRLELSYLDRKELVEGSRWGIELIFRETSGDDLATVRLIPGWSEETFAVESPRGPSMTVQPLSHLDAWRRLSLRFSPISTNFVLDGLELAKGGGVPGALVEIRFFTDQRGDLEEKPKDLAAFVDDLLLVRSIEPTAEPAVDPTQDSARLVSGDQLFGKVDSADLDKLVFSIDGKPATLPWTRVTSIDFKRVIAQSPPVEGLIVLARSRPGRGIDPADEDLVEGALHALDDTTIVVETPRAGLVSLPRDRLISLQALANSRRMILDSTSHHLGNDIVEALNDRLDPPQPEGKSLEIPFRLDSIPEGPAFLLLDVLQVAGESPGLQFADEISKGELRTDVSLNGKPVDYLNRHVLSDNRAIERVRLSIPKGLLKPGPNVLRFDQLGRKDNPDELDDFGLSRVVLEFEKGRR